MISPASPTIVTTADPLAIALGTPSTTLNDTADLEGGYNLTGALEFTLKQGSTIVFTQTDTITGNGAPAAGFTLPTTGTVTGTYTWTVAYGGDGNNNAANDQGGMAEQTVVSPAQPMLLTTAIAPVTRVGATSPTLTDTAVLAAGYFPTGVIDFTLTGPGGFSYTQSDTVSGNGTYAASTTLPVTVAGVYTWMARYSGDGNNNAANDQGGAAEQATVDPVSPTLITTPSPTAVTLGATVPPILTDSATLAGGANPTGTIIFTLFRGAALVDTEAVTVSNASPTTRLRPPWWTQRRSPSAATATTTPTR